MITRSTKCPKTLLYKRKCQVYTDAQIEYPNTFMSTPEYARRCGSSLLPSLFASALIQSVLLHVYALDILHYQRIHAAQSLSVRMFKSSNVEYCRYLMTVTSFSFFFLESKIR